MSFQDKPKICPVCQEGKYFKVIQDYRNQYGTFSLFECTLCETQFWMPFKNPGTEWYEKSNKYKIISDAIKPKIYKDYHKKFFKIYKNFSKNTKILDLGCGTGEFIAELQKRGCEVWGVDFDKDAIEVAKKYFKLKNVYNESFEDFFQRPDIFPFDIITFFEVVEHLDNPLKFIQNVKEILKSDGKIILTTPCRERFLVNLASWDFPPHHLTRWNKKALSNLFRKINFSISQVNYIGELKLLMAAFNEKFRGRLVNKVAQFSENRGKIKIFAKLIYFGALLKEYTLGFIPAIFLYILAKMIRRNQGTMLIELTSNTRKN
jgi:SAM-dependent methyltransferase